MPIGTKQSYRVTYSGEREIELDEPKLGLIVKFECLKRGRRNLLKFTTQNVPGWYLGGEGMTSEAFSHH